MSELDQLFKQAIDAASKKRGKFILSLGTVKAVDGDSCTVDHYEEVRLMAVIDTVSSHCIVCPKIGSKVVIGRLENQDTVIVLSVSEIESVRIKIDDLIFEMKDGKFVIKNGIVNLKTVLNATYEQLIGAVLTTPSGPGAFSAADITAFSSLKAQVNQLLV
jgi:hypothetical protein